ncbi:MAG: TMEM165/GDT1 family protein [Planctomycetota bacterium]|nr:TMEM165/GDT1 family protein [Planctomycetota bacterium]
MSTTVAISTFTLLFLAEIGDKSQLVAIALAHRYKPTPVLAGICSAFLLLTLMAASIGSVLQEWLSQAALLLVAGLLFLVFAYRTWREQHEDQPIEQGAGHRTAFLTSFTLILVAELGDKTQLATMALSAQSESVPSVVLGATLALWATSLLGVFAGARLLRHIPAAWVRRASTLLFLTFGLIATWRAVALWS